MPGKKPQLDHVKTDFLAEINSAISLLSAILNIPKSVNPVSGQLHPKHVRLIIEHAFLGFIAAWDEFLERALVRYVAGGKTSTNYAPLPKFGLAKDISQAYQFLSKNPHFRVGIDYLRSSDPKWYCTEADFIFSQHPFGVLKSKQQILQYTTSIRNRIAHNSDKCRTDFKVTAIAMLAPPKGKLPHGYGPGDLLRERAILYFGSSTTNISYFQAYLDTMKMLACHIIP